MNPPDLDALIRRLVGAAFDAGVTIGKRPSGHHQQAREDQVAYATSILRGHVQAEATRLATAASLVSWQEPG